MKSQKKERRRGLVKLRNGFSDRNGLVSINKIQQIDEFDDDTRIRIDNSLWQWMNVFFDNQEAFLYVPTKKGIKHEFCEALLNDAFCEKTVCIDRTSFSFETIYKNRIESVILQAEYNEVLDLLQYCGRWVDKSSKKNNTLLYDLFNALFEKEYVGYRFVSGYIVPITDKAELSEIAEACSNPYDGARSHMKKAVQYLSDRTLKDYKNCIKESISAVESTCKVISGKDKATLGDALVILEKKRALHPTLKNGFNRLYDYTSDKGGIRHAEGLFESSVTFNEAKYMLVSCSAFVNYLIAEYVTGSN